MPITYHCPLCDFHTTSLYSWESHLARDDHRTKQAAADRDALYEALRGLVNVCTHPQSTKADMKRIAEEARLVLAAVKE